MEREDNNTMLTVNCFTTSYNRPYFLYNTINNILNQSYTDIIYSININIDNDTDQNLYSKILKDFNNDQRLKIIYSYNENQHFNYIKAFTHCHDNENSIYIKIDDDDIYHKNYISNIISLFHNNTNIDILSFNINQIINNNKIQIDNMSSIGYWSGDNHNIKFGLPPTYAFNYKAKKIIENININEYRNIHAFEDAAWRTFWRENNLKSLIIDDKDNFTYHIHGNNVSSSYLLNNDIKNILDNQYCIISLFKHPSWESYLFLNKRNNRCYHINNNDHGSFTIIDDKAIINWDEWPEETFVKKIINNNCYYEKL